jgi:hypothetical protein
MPRREFGPRMRKLHAMPLRLPTEDIADLTMLAEGCGVPLRKWLCAAISEFLTGCNHEKPNFTENGIISSLRLHDDLKAVVQRLAKRGLRTLPNAKSKAVWVSFGPEQKALLDRLSKELHWSPSQVGVEALYTLIRFSAAKKRILVPPDIVMLCVGRRLFAINSSDAWLRDLNTRLGLKNSNADEI